MNTDRDYRPDDARYDGRMPYRRVGASGLLLPAVSLGLWQNFGFDTPLDKVRDILCAACDGGVTHFDLANNYGPPHGTAEVNFGHALKRDLMPYRDEIIVSTKAGYDMWPGPYGEWGSRKYLLASLDQSLRRMGLDYVDIFYSHRVDPNTPLHETMGALASAVQQGKALYVGISSYGPAKTREAVALLREWKTPCLIHQPSYSMVNRWIESDGLVETLGQLGVGAIAFSPLAQGLLTNKYLAGLPADARLHYSDSMRREWLTDNTLAAVKALDAVAKKRGQTLAQMAIAWVLRSPVVASALIGVRTKEQLLDCMAAVKNMDFAADELAAIDNACGKMDADINLWHASSAVK